MRLLLLACVLFIFAIGLMMVFNTSSAVILDCSLDRNLHQAFFKQITFAILGLIMAWGVYRLGYQKLLSAGLPLFLFGVGLLLLVFIPGIGHAKNGAHRWLGVGSFTFQPSEFMKYFIPLLYIQFVVKREGQEMDLRSFLKIGGIVAGGIFLVMIEPDNGAAAVMSANLLPLFFITGVRFKYWALPILAMMIVMGAVAFNLPYVKARLQVYLHPELDIKGKGHQPHQAKIAAGSGKLFGKGAGGSLQKFTYLPEAQNDYIAAIYAEEFGFLGMLVLLILYMTFAFAGFSIAIGAQSKGGCYLAMSITFLIALQAFLNLGVASALLPSKGINLPFFSQGGTSLIANAIGVALLFNISKSYEKKTCHS